MQLPRPAVRPDAPPVVEAEGGVGALLHLVDLRPRADGVDHPAGDEIRLEPLRLAPDHEILERPALYRPLHVVRPDARAEAHVERPRLEDAPHLRLRLAARNRGGRLAWMDLHRKREFGVYHLEEQREARLQLVEAPSGQRPGGDDAGTAGARRHLPALRPPHEGDKIRLEPHRRITPPGRRR